jgi:hypothetical protein
VCGKGLANVLLYFINQNHRSICGQVFHNCNQVACLSIRVVITLYVFCTYVYKEISMSNILCTTCSSYSVLKRAESAGETCFSKGDDSHDLDNMLIYKWPMVIYKKKKLVIVCKENHIF